MSAPLNPVALGQESWFLRGVHEPGSAGGEEKGRAGPPQLKLCKLLLWGPGFPLTWAGGDGGLWGRRKGEGGVWGQGGGAKGRK